MLHYYYYLPLIKKLRNLEIGCHIENVFFGGVFFADDSQLICPNRYAANRMLQLCEQWGNENCVYFSTDDDPKKSKTKVLVIGAKNTDNFAPLELYGKKLPFVRVPPSWNQSY